MSDVNEPTTGTARGFLVFAAILAITGGLLIYGNITMRVPAAGAFGPQTFPWIVAGLCLLTALLVVVEVVRHPERVIDDPDQDQFSGVSALHDPFDPTFAPAVQVEAEAEAQAEVEAGRAEADPGTNWRLLGIGLGTLVVFTLVLEPLGWLISATLLFWGMSLALGGRDHLRGLLIGLGLASMIQVVFSGLLGMPLPSGILGG